MKLKNLKKICKAKDLKMMTEKKLKLDFSVFPKKLLELFKEKILLKPLSQPVYVVLKIIFYKRH